MSVSNSSAALPHNALYKLAAAGALLLGVLLILGAYGHFVAVWSAITGEETGFLRRVLLMLPGAMLASTAALNILFTKPLWQARGYALTITLAGNLLTMLYLIYLMIQGVPDHPIGVFLALEMSQVILLVAIRAGLVWPAAADMPAATNTK
ncbi:hypothetical protein PVT68_02690 [Microbulbifer bruguierae]|uniref:Uncharacterized protein n=1 Tax=Microbulbifer bruguierae TaxID=3029061 RepID=A0ABY8NF44_9GAMM|nr:hypothetical protein [Microbulbifer bruguierae]WGL17217.1 hypothetical protein PVT68_02690 [Microbulbifer bruguierae]